MTKQPESVTEWWCTRGGAQKDATMRPAARGPRGPLQRSPLAVGDGEGSRRPPVPSEQRGRQGRPGAQHELDDAVQLVLVEVVD